MFKHPGIAHTDLGLKELEEQRYQSIISLSNELKDKRIRKVIFSSEGLSVRTKSEVAKLKKILSLIFPSSVKYHIVFSSRNPIDWVLSTTQQRLKGNGEYETPYQRKNELIKLYENSIGRFLDVFSEATFICYKFEDAIKYKQGPVGYFLKEIGYDEDEISQFQIFRENSSISQQCGDLLKFINFHVPYFKENSDIKEINKEQGRASTDTRLLETAIGDKLSMDDDAKYFVYYITKKQVEWLKEKTGIDYSDMSIVHPMPDDFRAYLSSVYNDLSPTIQELVNEYLELNSYDKIK